MTVASSPHPLIPFVFTVVTEIMLGSVWARAALPGLLRA